MSYTCIDLHVNYPLFLDFIQTWILKTDFGEINNTEFVENPSIGFRVVPCGRTDMMKVIVAFRSFCESA
jgi:hypothetical protein